MKKNLLKSLLAVALLLVCGNVWGENYQKVSSDQTDWTGEYLLVYEAGSLAWTGVDAGSCGVGVTISNGIISQVPDGAVTLTLEAMDGGGYSIKINGGSNNGKYIGKSDDSNGVDIKASAQKNTLSYSTDNGVLIAGTSGAVIRYNATSGQNRFRYFKAATYTGQKEVALYKKVVGVAVPAPTVEVSATEALSGTSVSVSISVPSGAAKVLYTDDGTDPTDEDNGPTEITTTTTFNVTSTSTIKAVSVDAAGNYSAVVTKTVNFYPVIEGLSALKSAARGTYYVELENAIVTYVNGKNAFIEDTEVGALIFMDNHGFNEGDCLNDVFKAVTTTFNGAFELITLESYSGDVTPNVEIPCTPLTLAQLSANFAAYESMRVKIEDVTVTDAIATGDRNGEISDGTNTMVLRAGVDGVAATVNATIKAIGYPTFYNTTNQFAVWEQDDIEEKLNVTVTSIAVSGYTANYNVGETFTFDGTVTATFSNGTTETVTPTSVSTPDMSTAGTKEVTVSYDYNGETVTATYQIIVAAPVEKTYILYNGELAEGDYIIYYDGKAMNTTITKDRLQYAEVTPEEGVITTDNEAIVWHIAKSGDYWTIYNAKAGKYAAGTGAANKAQLLADGTDDKALWTSTGKFEFVNKANAAAEVNANLRNNGTYGFACYSTTTGGALSLYKQGEVEAKELVEIMLSDCHTTYFVGQNFEFNGTCSAIFSNQDTLSVTPTSVSEPDMTTAGEKTVTVSYTYNNVTKEAKYTIIVNEVEDGVFDFTAGYDYGSGLTPSTSQPSSADAYVFKAGSVTITTGGTGNFLWNTELRIYANSNITIAAPEGFEITKIEFTGKDLNKGTIQGEAITSGTEFTWTGNAESVIVARNTATVQIMKLKVTYMRAGREEGTASFANDSIEMHVGETQTITVTTNSDGAVAYSSSNSGVVSVDETTGEITAIAAGTATITASIADTDFFTAASASYTVTVLFDAEGSGTETDPYTVADVIGLNNPATTSWVKGTILGFGKNVQQDGASMFTYVTDTLEFEPTNIVLGDAAGNIIPVQLPNTVIRTALNLVDNRSWIGCEVSLFGTLEKYFSLPGVKNTSDFTITIPNVISADEWATASLPFDATIVTEGTKAYYVYVDGSLRKDEVAGAIPAGEGVLLNGSAGAVTFAYTPASEENINASAVNQLVGNTTEFYGKKYMEADTKYYALANGTGENSIGFYYQVTDGTSATCGQYKAVLAVPASNASATGYRLIAIKGDVNEDGEVNVSDVTMLVSMILGNTPVTDAAKVNDDDEVNVSDVTALVSIILGQ